MVRDKNININGFSMIELLIVISIMVVLIGLSAFGLQQARESARDGQRKSDLETLRTGLSFYRADCNAYPTPNSSHYINKPFQGTCGGATNTYIDNTPSDPVSGRNYYYMQSGQTYTICSSSESETGPTPTQCAGANCGTGVNCNIFVVNP